MNKEYIKEKLSQLKNQIHAREIVIWGGGTHGEIVSEVLNELGLYCRTVIDSSIEISGSLKFGKVVRNPQYISGKNKTTFVIVAMTHFYDEVKNKLNDLGYIEAERDFVYIGTIKNIRCICSSIGEELNEYSDQYNNHIFGRFQAVNSKIIFKGVNNKVIIGKNTILRDCTIVFLSNDGVCMVGECSQYRGKIFIGSNCTVNIGNHLWVTNNCCITTAEDTSVEVGHDCMFASNNMISTHDYHPIYNVKNGERINKSKSIKIGDHVWLADRAVLLSGSNISNGSIVGHSAVVKTRIPNNCIAAGIPARIIKRDIAWDKTDLTQMHYEFASKYSSDKQYWNFTDLTIE
ncbi:acyltransferase [Cohnella algarum]|uniref:acyltransferase n=1 Tax=Cohnella algarum TaxID=2044859 RepID=UPI001967019B|nr:acyltransferase [Cohnella algarum]MBN2980608.1 acyltransferase [Cohnella algarum]